MAQVNIQRPSWVLPMCGKCAACLYDVGVCDLRKPGAKIAIKGKPSDYVQGLPTDAKARKAVPIYSGAIKYFPDAIAAVAALSLVANEQHNPGTPLHWDRSKSTDELDALTRHLFEAGTVDTDGQRHSTKVAWRALANLQKELEAARATNSD